MDIAYLKEFICLSSCLNYTAAAQTLHTTQPSLSRHISQLELELGVALFYRNKRTVSLTPEGESFLQDAIAIIEHYDNAIAKFRDCREGITGSLSVGYRRLYKDEKWLALLKGFRNKYPNINTQYLSYFGFDELYHHLFNGELDIIISIFLDEFKCDTFCSVPFETTSLVAVTNITHPLAKYKEISVSALENEPLILPHPLNHLSFTDSLHAFFSQYGIHENQILAARKIDEAELYVNLGAGINIIPKCYYADLYDLDLCGIDIIESRDLFEIRLISKRKNKNPAINLFLDMCEINT
jgi:DNA-binding transcriptional LysR family regulator